MTNREWLLKEMQNMSDEELAIRIVGLYWLCDEQRNKNECVDRFCGKCKLEWLKQEHKEKIKLSKVEKGMLENLDEKYKWIARDKDGTLCIYYIKPKKDIHICDWVNGEHMFNLSIFKHLFKFVKWEDEEPYSIEELLKLSEYEN